MRQARITGITGQDGGYLSKLLVDNGYRVFGLDRRTSTPTTERLQYLEMLDRITILDGDVTDQGSLVRALEAAEPAKSTIWPPSPSSARHGDNPF